VQRIMQRTVRIKRRSTVGVAVRIGSLLVLTLLPFTPAVHAETLPLWEIGLGGGALHTPDYRGAGHSRTYAFPFAFPFYRGEVLQSDAEGIRGVVFRSDRVRFDISVDGGVPVKSRDATVRHGMPDLDATAQIGPALNVKLWRRKTGNQSLVLFLPVRWVFSVGNGLGQVGYSFSPQLSYHRKVPFAGGDWKLGISGGLEYGSNGLHDYYYKVAPVYATVDRPAYDPKGGFAGYRVNVTFHHRYRNKWVSLFGRYDRVDGAVFEDSPLVVKREGVTVGFVVTWIVARSSKQVKSTDWIYQ
jgi:outer membrane protein